jgi:nucleotide-binding universal stress UspA family protein
LAGIVQWLQLEMKKDALRFKRILCPVDFSPASLRAFDLAVQVASYNQAHIHVLHVIPRIVASLMDIPIATTRWTVAEEEKSKRELPKLKDRAAQHGISTTTEIRIGDIDVQILKAMKDSRADLLAMGTHGRRGFERWALGSMAEKMLRYSPIPLLLTAAGSRRGAMRRILVACDFSEGNQDAIGHAANLAGKADASITMLHVIQDPSGAVDWNAFPEQTAAIKHRLQNLLPSRSRVSGEARVGRGQPYRVLLKAIKDSKPSLVVLNTHGHGFLERTLVGSTAERVVRGAAGISPILLIPPRPKSSRGSDIK